MISWQGKTVRVQARNVPRFLWTTASIDVFLSDQCVLRTGGQLKLTGSHSTSFSDGGAEHQIELRWGHSRNFRFPYQLRIDGITVDDSHVQVENRGVIIIPAFIIVALLIVFLSLAFWLMTTASNKSPEPTPRGHIPAVPVTDADPDFHPPGRTVSTINPASSSVDDSGPSPVTAQSAPSKASGAFVPPDPQLGARTKTLQRPRIQTSTNSPARLFVGESRPWPVNARSAPFKATGALVSSDQQVDAKVNTVAHPPVQAP
jgi:hypothetical protein